MFCDGAEAIHGYAGFAEFIRVETDAPLDLNARLGEFTTADEIDELLDLFLRWLLGMDCEKGLTQIGLKFRATQVSSIADEKHHAAVSDSIVGRSLSKKKNTSRIAESQVECQEQGVTN
jgi:hypothetical protein